MNFDFSDDQKMMRDSARKFLGDRSSLKVVRQALESDQPHDQALWAGIAEMGWLGTAVPEEYGGVGLGHLELCMIAEEIGRALAPVPFSSSVYLATEALLLAGTEAQKKHWLPKLVQGAIGTLAISEGVGSVSAANVQAKAGQGGLSGTKWPVADGAACDLLIVLARGADDRQSLYLVDAKAGGVQVQALKSLDPTRSAASITFTNAACELLGTAGQGLELVQSIYDRAAVLFAFEQVGGAQASLEMAKEFAMQRITFGRLIGSYQAIKHKLADMYVATELARSNAYYGAWALSTGSADLAVAAASARISAIDAYHLSSKENLQTHGGMGFTWAGDCHLYYRRAKWLAHVIGTNRTWKERLISQLERKNAA
jgi:alkylation response protein AidB-like acyl-CoA dehydrogenase